MYPQDSQLVETRRVALQDYLRHVVLLLPGLRDSTNRAELVSRLPFFGFVTLISIIDCKTQNFRSFRYGTNFRLSSIRENGVPNYAMTPGQVSSEDVSSSYAAL